MNGFNLWRDGDGRKGGMGGKGGKGGKGRMGGRVGGWEGRQCCGYSRVGWWVAGWLVFRQLWMSHCRWVWVGLADGTKEKNMVGVG